MHTPGPWSCEDVYPPRTTVHIPVYGKPFVLAECFSMESAGEREANAKLIAAAPDMLAALRRSLNWLSSYPGGGAMNYYDEVRAVIAKAIDE